MELVFAAFYASTFVRCTVALPITETEISWGPEPQFRGTLSILLTCLITLSLCVWTAIHLNVNPEPTKRRLFLFKWVWLLMGMFTPELVLWCAINQFLEAREIREKVMHIRREQLGISHPSCTGFWREQWVSLKRRCAILKRPFQKNASKDDQGKRTELQNFSMGCAFFVVMGGYVVHPAPGGFDGIPVTLTPCGFIQLYEEKMIKEKDLEPSLIADKTKADGLAKLIVCLQALWLVIQGIGRKATGLPLPLLELHTIMHVLCAVAMYWFWWDKPLDARFPIILDLEQHIAEEIYISYKNVRRNMPQLPTHHQSQSGTPKNEDSPPEDSAQSTENNRHDALEGQVSRISIEEALADGINENSRSLLPQTPPGILTNENSPPDASVQNAKPEDSRQKAVEGKVSRISVEEARANGTNVNPTTYSSHPGRLPNNTVRQRFGRNWAELNENYSAWELVILSPICLIWQYSDWHETFELWPQTREELTDVEVKLIQLARSHRNDDVTSRFELGSRGACVRARMIKQGGPLRNQSGDLTSWEPFLILGCLSVLYGGAHAGAWNTHLPSTVERLLWRVSSVIAGAFLPLSMAVFIISMIAYEWYDIGWYDDVKYWIMDHVKNFKRWVKARLPERLFPAGSNIYKWFITKPIMVALEVPFLIGVAALAIYILAGVSAFIFARTFLVVESFISLRSLPKGSFKTVPWSNYWPHF